MNKSRNWQRLLSVARWRVQRLLRRSLYVLFIVMTFLFGGWVQAIILLFLVGIAIILLRWSISQTDDLPGLALNLGSEIVGFVLTFILFEQVVGKRNKLEALKVKLIADLGSQIRDVAVRAAEELRLHGWLDDGSLKGARLFRADLQGAYLLNADLRGAYLLYANLQGAHLLNANLKGANLMGANLQGAILAGTIFDEETVLPDSDYDHRTKRFSSKWTPDTDVSRFTNLEHSQFWNFGGSP